MIIAPLMSPIQAFAFAALDGDAAMIRRLLFIDFAGAVIASGTSEVVARTRPNLPNLGRVRLS